MSRKPRWTLAQSGTAEGLTQSVMRAIAQGYIPEPDGLQFMYIQNKGVFVQTLLLRQDEASGMAIVLEADGLTHEIEQIDGWAVVSAPQAGSLVSAVNKMLAEGWSVFSSVVTDGREYHLSIAKYGEMEAPPPDDPDLKHLL